MLTAAELLRAKGTAAYGDATPLFGWLAGPGGTAAAFLHTPPFPVVLTDMTAAAAAGLAADLAGRGHQPPGVNAMPGPGAAFAAAWQEHIALAALPDGWRTQPGQGIWSAGRPFAGTLSLGRRRDLAGSQAIRPMPLPRSKTPADRRSSP